ncbi:MAG: hypothetical protein AB7O24_29780 [Kofleriaceae bacterium]
MRTLRKLPRKIPRYGSRAELLSTLIRELNLVRITIILIAIA